MSIATESGSQTSRYVDFDEFIDYQLHKAQSGIKTTDLLTALIGGAAALLAYVLLFAICDHWIVDGGFNRSTRLGLLALLLVVLMGWCLWKLVLPYFRRVSALYAAREIESTDPEFHNMLLTLVDLRQAGRPIPPEIRSALEKRAARSLSRIDVDEAIDRRWLMRLSYGLLALVVATSLYTIFSPKKLSNSLWRALLPTSDVLVDTRTRIDRVDPGSVEVLARAQLPVSVDLSGELPENVSLLFTTVDHRFVDEPLAMREAEDGLHRYRAILTGENGRGILQNLSYRVRAGDAESQTFQVTVKQPPTATVHEVLFEYPDYMSFDDRQQKGGSIDAWEGTWVTVRATTNVPVSSALVQFRDAEDTNLKAEELPAIVSEGRNITARWQLQLRADGTHPKFYQLQVRNEAGETDPEPTLYGLQIRPDEPPRIVLRHPESDIERPANAVIPLLFEVSDPDFLLRTVILRLEQEGSQLSVAPRLYEGPPYRQSVVGTYDFDLSRLPLRPGDRLTYWLEARDNMEPFADRSGNRTNTPKLNIDIVDAVSPEEVEQQLAEEKQKLQEQLQTAETDANDEAQPPGEQVADAGETTPPEPGEAQPPAEGTQETEQTTSDNDEIDSSGKGAPQASEGGEGPTEDQQPGDSAGGAPPDENSQPTGEEPFEEMLRRLMELEQEREAQQGRNTSPGGPSTPREQRQPPEADPSSDTPTPNETPQPASNATEQSPPQTGDEAPQREPSPSPAATPQTNPGDAASSEESTPSGPSSPDDGSGSSEPSPNPPDRNVPPSTPTGEPPMGDQTTSPATPNDTPGGDPSRQESAEPGTSPDRRSDDAASPDSPTARSAEDPATSPPSREVPQPPESGTPTPGKQPSSPPAGDPGASSQQPSPSEGPAGQPPGTPDPSAPNQQPPARTGNQPTGPDEPLQGDGRPDGQRSDQPQTGEGGSSQQTSQGNPGPEGAGDTTAQPGEQSPAGGQTGQPGQQPGEGSQQGAGGDSPMNDSGSGSSAPGGMQDQNRQPGSDELGENTPEPAPQGPQGQSDPASAEGGAPSGGEPGQGGGASAGAGQSGSPAGGAAPQQGGSGSGGIPPAGTEASPTAGQGGGDGAPQPHGNGTGGGADSSAITPEEADLANKRKAANLVLERLKEQLERGEMDAEWRERLGVSDEQLRDFGQRLEQRLADQGDDLSPEGQARRRQFEETLRTIEFDSRGASREGGTGPRDAAGGFGGARRIAPPQHRDAAEAYREMLSRKRRSSTVPTE